MKWTVKLIKLIAETHHGSRVEQEVASIERGEVVSPATVGLTIAEGEPSLRAYRSRGRGTDSTSWCQHFGLSAMRKAVPHQGLLSLHSSISVWEYPDTRPPYQGMLVLRIAEPELLDPLHE
jgi:hypothetical protein